jgi:ribonuclease G
MTREMYVSSTPHETKVGIVEDDQLAEIFFERENEYTLAGSIYKGRVTRVLPGMQSAFVDIGLERDAFLYVSDFLELADEEEFEELQVTRPEVYVTNRPPQEPKVFDFRPAEPARAPAPEPASDTDLESDEEAAEGNTQEYAEGEVSGDAQRDAEGDRSFRGGRRRRRGRRGRGFPESKFARPRPEDGEPEPEREQATPQFGHVPGQQRILLPGESISKYQRAEPHAEPHTTAPEPAPVSDEDVALPVEDVAPAETPERIQPLPAPRSAEVAARVLLPGESIAKYRRGESQGENNTVTPEQAAAQTVQQEAPVVPPRHEREERPRRERYEAPQGREPRVAPVVLPGESISKYRRLAERQAATPAASEPAPPPAAPTFVIESEPFGEPAEREEHAPPLASAAPQTAQAEREPTEPAEEEHRIE